VDGELLRGDDTDRAEDRPRTLTLQTDETLRVRGKLRILCKTRWGRWRPRQKVELRGA
jgi:hypothetical protein